jgi:tricorn protease
LGGTGNFAVSGDGKSILVLQASNLGIIKPAPEQKIEKPLRIAGMEMTVNPREEWDQLLTIPGAVTVISFMIPASAGRLE